MTDPKINIKPYILHFVMVLGVTAYVFIGAYTIRHIEATKTGFITKADRILENVGRTRHHDQPPPQYERVTERFKRKTNLHRARKCVQIAMKRLASGECDPNNLISPTHPVFLELDECYKRDVQEKVKRAMNDAEAETATPIVEPLQSKNSTTTEWEYWSLKDSILFCFTVITTIGYGNVAPQTFNGQLFVIIYGLIGVPFAMLVIANLGKFLAELLKAINKKMYKCAR
uniref:Ion_trans_2 domain-containing protein n=1 Tax=Bursaphelenchus xylophilus TaxID=6326 RepID=A0A1I7SU44_BURXY